VSARVVIDCGAADTRAALIEGDEVIRFWFGPARGDEHLPRAPEEGDLFFARVRAASKPLSGAFVDIGAGRDAFLSTKGDPPVEGEALIVAVRRPPIGAKGALVSGDWRGGLQARDVAAVEDAAKAAITPCQLGARADPALAAYGALVDPGAPVVVNDPASAAALRARGVRRVAVEQSPFQRHGGEDALAAALDRTVVLPSGGRMIFDENEAATAVDIDSGSAADGAFGKLNERINAEAAALLFGELSRRGIGGRIVVDFLAPGDAAARARLLAQLRTGATGLFHGRLGKLSADGLFDLTAPRRCLSLLERTSEVCGAGWLRRGRRLTLDWRAKSAIRALEARLSSRPSARFKLLAGSAITDYLRDERPQWGGRLAEGYGGRFAVETRAEFEERNFDVAE
jgi:Ribonuclease G/E